MLLQKNFQLATKVVARTHDVLNVLQVTKLWVEFVCLWHGDRNPFAFEFCRNLRFDRINPIPNTRMVSKAVAQSNGTLYPTPKYLMLWQTELPCDSLFERIVWEVTEELRERAERRNLQCFPYRRNIGSVVFLKMVLNEIFLRTLNLFPYLREVVLERSSVDAKSFICEPKSTMF